MNIAQDAQALLPNWTDVVTTLATVTLAVFAVVATWQILELRRDRHFRVITEVLGRWDSLDGPREQSTGYTPTDLRTLVERNHQPNRTAADRAAYIQVMKIADFFEDLGGHVEEGALTKKVVAGYLASDVLMHHERWQDTIAFFQQRKPTNLRRFDQLAEDIRELRRMDPEKY